MKTMTFIEATGLRTRENVLTLIDPAHPRARTPKRHRSNPAAEPTPPG
jgi:hypothetical protein